jgi:hypothetical protein
VPRQLTILRRTSREICGARIAACRNSFLLKFADWINESMMVFGCPLFIVFVCFILTRLQFVFAPNLFFSPGDPHTASAAAASLVWPGTPFFYTHIMFMKCIYEV